MGPSVIGPDDEFRGNLKTRDAIEIHGAVRGEVHCRAELTVCPDGEVEGLTEGNHVIVQGRVQGQVQASRQLEIHAGAKFQAEVVYQPEVLVLSSKLTIDDVQRKQG